MFRKNQFSNPTEKLNSTSGKISLMKFPGLKKLKENKKNTFYPIRHKRIPLKNHKENF